MTGIRNSWALRAALVVALAALAAACSTLTAAPELARLRAAEPAGNEFSRALSQEYLHLANFEADEMMDWRDAQRYTRKGLAAAAGTVVDPTDPGTWRIPVEHRQDLADAREQLTRRFEAGVRDLQPATAAAAQANFDCWVEQQEENWQADHIAACRSAFETALGLLDQAIAKHRAKLAARNIAAPEPVQFYFTFNSFLLDGAALAALRDAADGLDMQAYSLVVTGHADRAGTEAYNWTLSLDRAHAALGALLARGIPRTKVLVKAAGEIEPAVDTEDGVREPKNRRVEIKFVTTAPRLAAATTEDQVPFQVAN